MSKKIMKNIDNLFKNFSLKVVLPLLLLVSLAGCGKKYVSNMKDYTADFLGNQDNYVTRNEKKFVKDLMKELKKEPQNKIYVPFTINKKGEFDLSNTISFRDSVPERYENFSVTEYSPGFSERELKIMAFSGRKLPPNRTWTEKDFIENNFGYKEIDQNGEISGTYLLTEKGMKKVN